MQSPEGGHVEILPRAVGLARAAEPPHQPGILRAEVGLVADVHGQAGDFLITLGNLRGGHPLGRQFRCVGRVVQVGRVIERQAMFLGQLHDRVADSLVLISFEGEETPRPTQPKMRIMRKSRSKAAGDRAVTEVFCPQ